MNPAFHFDKLKNISSIIVECTKKLIGRWKEIAKAGEILNIHPELAKVISHIILVDSFSKLGLDIIGLSDICIISLSKIFFLNHDYPLISTLELNNLIVLHC